MRTRLHIAATAILLAGGALLGLAAEVRRPGPECPDRVPSGAVRRSLRADPDQPLRADSTDVALVIACTLRKDRTEPWGNPRPTTPFLERLAGAGVSFERTIVQAPWTRPSVGSMVTGRTPAVLRLDEPDFQAANDRALPPDETTLAEVFQAAGYQTVGVSGNPNVSGTFGFSQGFGHFAESGTLWRQGPADLPRGRDLADRALAEVAALPEGDRLFLQVVLVDTHVPRTPDRLSRGMLRHSPLQAPSSMMRARLGEYDAAVRTLDAAAARLFVRLRKERPNLLFVLVGDHGEGLALPSRHGVAHGNFLYSTVLDVPQIWYHPSLPDPGRRIGGLATGLHVAPTLLDLLGIAVPAPMEAPSLADAVRGLTDRVAPSTAFSETWFRESARTSVTAPLSDGTWHLVRDHTRRGRRAEDRGREELYRLDDGAEVLDRALTRPDILETLSEALDAWEDETRRRAAEAGPPVLAHVADEAKRQLEAMGYLETTP